MLSVLSVGHFASPSHVIFRIASPLDHLRRTCTEEGGEKLFGFKGYRAVKESGSNKGLERHVLAPKFSPSESSLKLDMDVFALWWDSYCPWTASVGTCQKQQQLALPCDRIESSMLIVFPMKGPTSLALIPRCIRVSTCSSLLRSRPISRGA